MVRQGRHFLLDSNTRQVWPGIISAKSRKMRPACIILFVQPQQWSSNNNFFVKTINRGTVW